MKRDRARIEKLVEGALAEIAQLHQKTTVPIERMIGGRCRGQARQNLLDLLRPAHMVRQNILAGRRLEAGELKASLPEATGLEILLAVFDDARLQDAHDIAARELLNVRAALGIARRCNARDELIAYIEEQILFFSRMHTVTEALLRERRLRGS